jgi:phosphopantetheine adenylyltransferase
VALPLALPPVAAAARARLFAGAQAAVAAAYRAACAAARGAGVEVAADVSDDGGDDDDNGRPGAAVAVDVGGVLVTFGEAGEEAAAPGGWLGPVVSLAGLARRRGGWEAVWVAESPEGERVRRRFERLAGAGVAVRGVPVPSPSPGDVGPDREGKELGAAETAARCKSVIVGGTFDHLHVGHKLLLTMTAFALDTPRPEDSADERMITVGMTAADLLVKKKYAEALQPWHARTRRAHAFLRGILRPDLDGTEEDAEQVEEVHAPGPNGHAVRVRMAPREGGAPAVMLNYVEIWDPFGPTITDARIDTLVVSAETRSGGVAVNEKRRELGMAEVVIHEVDVLDAATDGEGAAQKEGFEDKLSSTEIRRAMVERRRGGRSKV